jgi:hypothetical protein
VYYTVCCSLRKTAFLFNHLHRCYKIAFEKRYTESKANDVYSIKKLKLAKMTQIKFSKKEIKEILKNDFSIELQKLSEKNKNYKCFYRSGAIYTSQTQMIKYFQEHEGNYFSLNQEMKIEFESLLS